MFRLILTGGIVLMTAYVFWRFWRAFPKAGRWRWGVLAGLVALSFSWMIARWIGRLGMEGLSETIETVAAIWLVAAFWFVMAGLACEAWNLLIWLLGLAWRPARRALLPARWAFVGLCVLILAAGTWAWHEASNIRVHHVEIEVADLPAGMDEVRVAQISDLHIGSIRSRQRLDTAIDLIHKLQPDALVSTGDLVDGEFHRIGKLAEAFSDINPPLGKFAVLGNHEAYAGVDDSLRFHEVAGFRVLRSGAARPVDGLVFVGVDDPAVGRRGGRSRTGEHYPLPGRPDGQLVILLKHQPRVRSESLGRFHVQLSGHTHGGQVFPFGFFTKLQYDFAPGLHTVGNPSKLFISRGTGTWGPPLRLGSPPEVTLITFKRRAP